MQTELHSLDAYISTTDWLESRKQPVAVVINEELEPASGPDSIIFPPTYARDKDSEIKHPYAIDILSTASPQDAGKTIEANICTLDSVGSQANRMEPIFAQKPLDSLVPQINVIAGGTSVSILEFGHRLADGALRFSDLAEVASQAIAAWSKNGNAEIIGKLAPTSLVFGFWDSRNSGLKVGRVVSSVIRATNVATLKRSAQFSASRAIRADMEKADEEGVLSMGDNRAGLSEAGLLDAPSVDTHGGIRVYGRIYHRTEINLIALRSLMVKTEKGIDDKRTLKLRRYILGLSLVAARAQNTFDLRQGCLLVGKEGESAVTQLVAPDGKREDFTFTFEEALEFAKAAAAEFGVGSNRDGTFDIGRVKETLDKNAIKKASKKNAKKQAKADA